MCSLAFSVFWCSLWGCRVSGPFFNGGDWFDSISALPPLLCGWKGEPTSVDRRNMLKKKKRKNYEGGSHAFCGRSSLPCRAACAGEAGAPCLFTDRHRMPRAFLRFASLERGDCCFKSIEIDRAVCSDKTHFPLRIRRSLTATYSWPSDERSRTCRYRCSTAHRLMSCPQ